jgi:hypothetical protein
MSDEIKELEAIMSQFKAWMDDKLRGSSQEVHQAAMDTEFALEKLRRRMLSQIGPKQ